MSAPVASPVSDAALSTTVKPDKSQLWDGSQIRPVFNITASARQERRR